MRSSGKDLLAVLAAGIIFLTSGWLFYSDINSTLKNIEGEQIGVIIFKKNNAQRKYTGRTVWENVETTSPLYNNDTIRTSSESEAVILMNDGTEISLQDSSLIVLEWGDEEKNIEFFGGNISAKNKAADNRAVNIKSADTVISLSDATVKLEQGLEGKLGLSVVAGNIDVRKGDITQEVRANQKALIDRNLDRFTIDDFSIQPDRPDDNSYFLTFNNSHDILFSWEVLKTVADPVFQISGDLDFKKIVDQTPTGREKNIIKTLPEGTYYWRIISGVTGETESQARRFVVINDNFPNPVSPAPELEIKYRNQLPKIRFLWNQGIFADYYLLEIAKSERLESPLVTEKVRGNFQIINNLDEGNYFWRVTPHYSLGGIGYAQKGKTQNFMVRRNTELYPVSLIYPPDKSELTTIETARGLKFKWKEDPEISSYQFYFSENPSFSDTLYNEPSSVPSFSINDEIKQGTYYWKIGGITTDNEVLPHSEIRAITVKQATGEIALTNPPFDEHFEIPQFGSRTFTWDSSVGENFKFVLYKDSISSAPIIEDNLKGKSRKTLIPAAGDYFWQVSVIDDNNRAVIESPISRFSTRIPLENPVITSPKENSEIQIIGDIPLEINWDKVAGADSYSAEIINESTGKTVIAKTETPDNSIIFTKTKELSEGIHTVKLKAVKKAAGKWGISQSGETELRFMISDVIVYDPPVLLSPSDKKIVNMEEVLNGNLVFSWQHRPILSRYEISISDSYNFDRNLSIFSAAGTGFRLTEIKPGKYFWKVKGYDENNHDSPLSKVNSLIVEALKPLLQPVILSPGNGENINMDNKDSLILKWKESPEAEYYSYKFHQEGVTGKVLASADNFKGTEITFKDLDKLDIGSFRFEVQAWKELPGNEKRKSLVSSSSFKISLSQPDPENVEIIIIRE
ncbi:MAG: FecR domain-containing protein [Spirochaetia bacterium]|jgi:hypothetical protein|nr:FecR domain-containing protein [Spirochaetia bacterium]